MDRESKSYKKQSMLETSIPSNGNDVLGRQPIEDTLRRNDGQDFVGIHLLIDLWGVKKNMSSKAKISDTLRRAALVANATEVGLKVNKFPHNKGVSGILLLSESHISIHTWPEISFVAIDVFMCGRSDPYCCLEVFRAEFNPDRVEYFERRRGLNN